MDKDLAVMFEIVKDYRGLQLMASLLTNRVVQLAYRILEEMANCNSVSEFVDDKSRVGKMIKFKCVCVC